MTTHSYLIVRTNISTQSVVASCPKKLGKGDDYINGNVNVAGYRFGVKDAVDEFASIYNLRVNIIWKDRKPEAGGPMPQWYLYKC